MYETKENKRNNDKSALLTTKDIDIVNFYILTFSVLFLATAKHRLKRCGKAKCRFECQETVHCVRSKVTTVVEYQILQRCVLPVFFPVDFLIWQ